MTAEIIIVLGLVVVAIVLFSTEKIPIDLTALLVMAFLMVSGIISVEEGVSGFSNDATVTIAALFVVSGALVRTGFAESVGNLLVGFFKRSGFWTGVLSMMVMIGIISAFINNTPVVAIFIPVMLRVADEINVSGSKLLMPLSFAAIFGGTCTLIGTSTNILVSSIVKSRGLEPFGMFEFTQLGIIFLFLGTTYMIFIGIRLIPERRKKEDLADSFGIREFISEIIILPGSSSAGKAIKDSPLVKDTGISIIEVHGEGKNVVLPRGDTVLNEGDVLVVTGDIETIKNLQERDEVAWKHEHKFTDADLATDDIVLIEAIISANSFLVGRSFKSTNFRNRYRGLAIGLRHGGKTITKKLGTTKLQAGDALLIEVKKENLAKFYESGDFVFINKIPVKSYKKKMMIPTLLVLGAIIALPALEILPIVVTSVAGSVLLVLMGSINLEEAYKSIEWRVIFLLAGAITMGIALDRSGAAGLISDGLIYMTGGDNPYILVSLFYITTVILTAIMSNNATVALIIPIAIVTASNLGIDSRPLLIAVMFAASADFMTPIGYQTNTMIYSTGRYRFFDFVKVGGPLEFIFWLTATLLIPVFFPFR